MTAVWRPSLVFEDGGRCSFCHSQSLQPWTWAGKTMSSSGWKNKVSRRQKKLHQKEHGSHMRTSTAELTSSRTQMQRSTSDSNWLLPFETPTRSKHYRTHSAPLFYALFASVHKKTCFFSQIPAHLKHFESKKTEVRGNVCLCQVYTLFRFLSVSVNASKICICDSQKGKTFHQHVVFEDSAPACWYTFPAWS